MSQLSRGGVIEETPIDPQAAWFSILEASPDVPANYRNAMMRISRIVDPMGEAAARYLALSQVQPVARQIPTPQPPTLLEQSEEYRRKARALREKRQQQQPFQAQVQYTDTRSFQAEIWRDRVTGKNLEAEVSSDTRVSEATVLKLQANLQRRWVRQPQDRETTQQAAAYVRSRITENWLSHDVQRGKNDLLYYRGVPLLPETEGKVVYSDVRQVMREGRHLTSNELLKVTVDMARGAFDFWIGEDLKTLQDPEEALGWRILAGFSLATTIIPGSALEKAAVRLLGKVDRKILVELIRKFEPTYGTLGYNPFKGKTIYEVEEMLLKKGFTYKGKGSFELGEGNFIHPKTGRSYHIDPKGVGSYSGEPSHVDVQYDKAVRKEFKRKYGKEKRKYWEVLDESF